MEQEIRLSDLKKGERFQLATSNEDDVITFLGSRQEAGQTVYQYKNNFGIKVTTKNNYIILKKLK